jgi:hypothetical protein
MKQLLIIFSLLAFITSAHSQSAIDDEVKQVVIQQSIASYTASCASSYSNMRDDRRCSKRSAYSKSGCYAPLLLQSDTIFFSVT